MRHSISIATTGRAVLAAMCAALVVAFAWAGPHSPRAQAATTEPLPKFSAVADFVARELAIDAASEPGTILSKSNVQPIFKGLRQIGWKVADEAAILSKIPSDNDYVVVQLRTANGRKFMRKIGGYPLAYDRLFRLVNLPRGRQLVYDLIHAKGGYEMIEYLTTTKGGKNMGKMLGKTAKGTDFNKPTGQIYTAEALLKALRLSYDSAVQSRQ